MSLYSQLSAPNPAMELAGSAGSSCFLVSLLAAMAHLEQSRSWTAHLGSLAGVLVVVLAGVSAAFLVENYRDSQNQTAELPQALSGVIAELKRIGTMGREFADDCTAKISEWEQADHAGKRATIAFQGATHPPSAAWLLNNANEEAWCEKFGAIVEFAIAEKR